MTSYEQIEGLKDMILELESEVEALKEENELMFKELEGEKNKSNKE